MNARRAPDLDRIPARAFAARVASAPDQRLAQGVAGLVAHLAAMVEDLSVTRDELRAILGFLTEVGDTCSEHRQEWVLLADTLGLTSAVENNIAQRPCGTTPNTISGPFYRADAPARADGASISLDGIGAPLKLDLHVTDLDAAPVAGARLEIWHANSMGVYENQDPDMQPEFNLRGIFTTGTGGQVKLRTIRPVGYDVPGDGPVGRLMSRLGIALRRPAHLHFRISAPDFDVLTTHVFDASDPAIAVDPLFAVHAELLTEFTSTRTADQGHERHGTFRFVLARKPRQRPAIRNFA